METITTSNQTEIVKTVVQNVKKLQYLPGLLDHNRNPFNQQNPQKVKLILVLMEEINRIVCYVMTLVHVVMKALDIIMILIMEFVLTSVS